jgi:hypothetical protein
MKDIITLLDGIPKVVPRSRGVIKQMAAARDYIKEHGLVVLHSNDFNNHILKTIPHAVVVLDRSGKNYVYKPVTSRELYDKATRSAPTGLYFYYAETLIPLTSDSGVLQEWRYDGEQWVKAGCPQRRPAHVCPDSPDGQHHFTPDLEYDSANPPVNCEFCGEPEP